ncbi:MAG TPA: hypothetical protein VGL61_06510 [Kofleriaceae bacterium]|jgi:hypothetical protein
MTMSYKPGTFDRLDAVAGRVLRDRARLGADERAAMLARLRADGADISDAKSDAYVASFYRGYYRLDDGNHTASGRALGTNVDPHDHAVRESVGGTANAGAYGAQQGKSEVPDVTTMAEWKRAANALGAYPPAVREQVLAKLRSTSSLVGDQVLASFESAWRAGDVLAQPSDEQAEHSDASVVAIEARQRISRARAAAEFAKPSKASELRDAASKRTKS